MIGVSNKAVPLFPDEDRSDAYGKILNHLYYMSTQSFNDLNDGYVQKSYQKEIFMLKYMLDAMYGKVNPGWKKEWEKLLLEYKLVNE